MNQILTKEDKIAIAITQIKVRNTLIRISYIATAIMLMIINFYVLISNVLLAEIMYTFITIPICIYLLVNLVKLQSNEKLAIWEVKGR